MSPSNWWGQRLGVAPARREAPGTPTYVAGQPYPPPPVGATAPPAPMGPGGPGSTDVHDPSGHHARIWEWQGNPRGGAGETAVTGNCPNCGSPRYFSKRGSGGVSTAAGVVYPAAECFECGYPRIQGTLSGPVSAQGPAHVARQGSSPAPSGVLGSLSGR